MADVFFGKALDCKPSCYSSSHNSSTSLFTCSKKWDNLKQWTSLEVKQQIGTETVTNIFIFIAPSIAKPVFIRKFDLAVVRNGEFSFLKLLSAIFIKFLFFYQMIALQKLWKMLFISSKKLFLFSRYSIFCISVLPSLSTCRSLLWRMIKDKS